MSANDPDFAVRQQRIRASLADALAVLKDAAAGPPGKAQRRAQRALERRARAIRAGAPRERR